MILANYAPGTCTMYNLNFEHCGMMRDRHTVGMSLTVGEVCLSRLTNEGGREGERAGVCVLGDWAGRGGAGRGGWTISPSPLHWLLHSMPAVLILQGIHWSFQISQECSY